MDEELIQDFKELFEFDTEKKKNILNKLINENIIKDAPFSELLRYFFVLRL